MISQIKEALNHELCGLEIYNKLAQIYNAPLFLQIASVRQNGYDMLLKLADDFSPQSSQTKPNSGKNYIDALILAIAFEIKTCEFYDEITSQIQDENLRDLFFRLWATSENEYKKALNSELFATFLAQNQNDKSPSLDLFFKDLQNGKFNTDEVLNFIKNGGLTNLNLGDITQSLIKNLQKGE